MRSARVTPNTAATPNDYNALVNDASGAAVLLTHQMYGKIALPTNPSNTQTLTLDINGTNIVITFVSAIGSTAGNVLIGATAAATAANLLQLLLNPTITNATQVALGVNTSVNVTLINYINWSLSGTTIVPSSYNSILYAPATSFSASTTATGGSYTANTMALYVEPGVVYVNGSEVYFAGGITPTVTAPSSHPRIDVLTLDSSGTLAWTTGSENVSPSVPTYPANKLPICELYNVTGETALYDNANQTSGQGYIYNDVRPFLMYPINLAAIPDSILPSATNTYNLGSLANQWQYLYAQAVYINGIQLADRFGGTGADGALTVTSGTTTIAAGSSIVLLKNYASISITGTAYVQCTTSSATGSAFILKSQGSVTLTSSAAPMLDASGCGATGGTGISANSAGNPGTAGSIYLIQGNGGTGGVGSAGGTVGIAVQSPNLSLNKYPNIFCGGGGGGGASNGTGTGGNGGAGGGGLVIECGGAWNFTTSAGISVLGLAGASGSGGTARSPGGTGGSGYFLALYNTLTANSGTVSAGSVAGTAGGNSGNSGGGGAGAQTGGAPTSSNDTGGAGGAGISLITLNTDY